MHHIVAVVRSGLPHTHHDESEISIHNSECEYGDNFTKMFSVKTKVEATHDIFGESFNGAVVVALPGRATELAILLHIRY